MALYLPILLLAASKWMMAVFLVLAGQRFGFWTALALLWGGGMAGVLLYTYLGEFVFRWWRRAFPVPEGKVRVTRLKRFIVRVRRRHGLAGIAAVTPILLTVPIGTVAAHILEPDRRKVLVAMALSFGLWALAFAALDGLFDGPLGAGIRALTGKG